jgi:hypothetical protein
MGVPGTAMDRVVAGRGEGDEVLIETSIPSAAALSVHRSRAPSAAMTTQIAMVTDRSALIEVSASRWRVSPQEPLQPADRAST